MLFIVAVFRWTVNPITEKICPFTVGSGLTAERFRAMLDGPQKRGSLHSTKTQTKGVAMIQLAVAERPEIEPILTHQQVADIANSLVLPKEVNKDALAEFPAYPFGIEIEGETAMFADPQYGQNPVSYIVPPWSAAKGIAECFAKISEAIIVPVACDICFDVSRFTTGHNHSCNSMRFLKKNTNTTNDRPNQRITENPLVKPVFQIHFYVFNLGFALTPKQFRDIPRSSNHSHRLQDMLLRRIANGSYRKVPCLGRSEHLPTYVGPLREKTTRSDVSIVLPSILHSPFEFDQTSGKGNICPRFRRNVRIEKGRMFYYA